jgi:hypothetical protein
MTNIVVIYLYSTVESLQQDLNDCTSVHNIPGMFVHPCIF